MLPIIPNHSQLSLALAIITIVLLAIIVIIWYYHFFQAFLEPPAVSIMSTSSGTPATETAGHDPNAVPGSSSRRFFMLRPRQDSEQAHQDPYITSSGFRPCFIGRYIRRFCKTLDNPGRNHGTWPTTLNSRPRFCQWGREYWPDLLLLAVLGLASLFIFLFAPPALAQHRRFPLYNPDGSVVNQSIAYPLTENIIPIWLSALLSIVVPVIVYLLMFLRVKSFWDLNNAVSPRQAHAATKLTFSDPGDHLRSCSRRALPTDSEKACRWLSTTLSRPLQAKASYV